jgi:RNA polymerase sigma-70 factor (ECF subfamily)
MAELAPSGALASGAYRRILDHFQVPLARFVRALVGSDEEARDIVQDVFVDAWLATQRGMHPFTQGRTERAVRNWLYHAAYCNAVSVLRRRSVIAWESLDVVDVVDAGDAVERHSPVPFDERVVERAELRAVLATLEPADLACLRLGIIEDFTTIEMAQILGITPEAARKRLSRAMHRLRAGYFARRDAALERERR